MVECSSVKESQVEPRKSLADSSRAKKSHGSL